MFNYFLAAAAVLVAGFAAAAANGSRGLAIIIAVVGRGDQLLLHRLDARNEELVSVRAERVAGGGAAAVPGAQEGRHARGGGHDHPAGRRGVPGRDLAGGRPARPVDAGFVESFQRGKHAVFLRLIEQTICGFFVLAIGIAAIFPGGGGDKGKAEPGKVDVARLTERVDSLKTAIDNSSVTQQAAQERLRASVSQTTTDLTARLDELEEKLDGRGHGADKAQVATKGPAKATRKRRGPTTR